MKSNRIYWQLSLFYFFFFLTLGAFVPFWPLYLKYQSYTATEIGQLMAITMLGKLVSPYLLGWLADHTNLKLRIVQSALLVALISFSSIFWANSFIFLALVMLFFGFFWHATLPLFEAVTLNSLVGLTNRYTHIRLWGSIGFIVAVIFLPGLMSDNGVRYLPYVVWCLLCITLMSTLLVEDFRGDSQVSSPLDIASVIKMPVVILLFLACIFQAISHGSYYTFFSIYLGEAGYSEKSIGLYWALGVFAEVLLFIVSYRFLSLGSARFYFSLALFLTMVRWLLLSQYVELAGMLIFIQILHAASYGLFHASAILMVHEFFKGRLQSRGQALYASLTFGLGGALGSLLSGYTWDSYGAELTYLFSGIASLLAFLFSIWQIRVSGRVVTI